VFPRGPAALEPWREQRASRQRCTAWNLSIQIRRYLPAVAEATAVGQLIAVGPEGPSDVAVDRCVGADFVLQP